MEKIKNKSLKKYFLGTTFFIIIISICGTIYYINNSSITSQYSKQAINILKDFKNTTITADEAHNKIETLKNRVDEERKNVEVDSDDDFNLLSLGIKLDSISWELLGDNNIMSSSSFTLSEINQYITELKMYH